LSGTGYNHKINTDDLAIRRLFPLNKLTAWIDRWMNKLNGSIDRFAFRHPGFAIPNLMLYVVGMNVLVYLLTVFSSLSAVQFLAFDWNAICRGELWRLVTFPFLSGYSSIRDVFWLAMFLYFYYWIGSMLEREWGSAKFTLYYLSGIVLTALVGVILGLIGGGAYIAGAGYVNLSMFFAFAMLYPDAQVLLFFFIPVKIKWLAWLDAAFFGLNVLSSLFRGSMLGVFLPIIALLNFFVFFWPQLMDFVGFQRRRAKYSTSHQTIQFKTAARQQRQKEAQRGYRHKCDVCGRTDTDYPDLEFRYCSKCAGYHCFCQDHIYNHEHYLQ